jgi:hypothetical protein
MRTGDLVRVVGNSEVGRIVAVELEPCPFQHDQAIESFLVEFPQSEKQWFTEEQLYVFESFFSSQ